MGHPKYFNVEYAINPHMLRADGQLQSVDTIKAQTQWETLKQTYEKLGFRVDVLDAPPGLPDFVFAANQTFPFQLRGRQFCLLSNMTSPARKNEVPHYERFFRHQSFEIISAPDFQFEGCGDALFDFEGERLFLGHGFRTSPLAAPLLQTLTGLPVVPLELISSNFYHLDTCLTIFNSEAAAYVPEAFNDDGIKTLKSAFRNLIEIDPQEAQVGFAGNAHCPDGRHILVHNKTPKFQRDVYQLGFEPIPIDTSEFIKSGGSVFCMKMAFN